MMQKAVRWPCGVCVRGVGKNSIQYTSCKMWVHRKCGGIKGMTVNKKDVLPWVIQRLYLPDLQQTATT